MPPLSKHHSTSSTKLLLMGDSGAGKSGSICSLAAAGYKVRVLDLDNGIDVVSNILRSPSSPYPAEALQNVSYVTLTEPMKNLNGRLIPSKATVWTRMTALLQNWKTEDEDFGPVASWGSDTVLVLDSLTRASQAALNWVLSMNSRLGIRVDQSDWYGAQQAIEAMLQTFADTGIKCNIVVNAHILMLGEENNLHGYPMTAGKALSPKVGTYFNTMVQAKTQGTGTTSRRKLSTVSSSLVELKTSNPLVMKPSYPIETGLAEIFAALRGEAQPTVLKPGVVLP